MSCNKVSFQELLDWFDNDLENNVWKLEHNAQELLDWFDNGLENNVWKLEHNAEKLQEILNRE